MPDRTRAAREPRPPLLPAEDRLSARPVVLEPEATIERRAFLDADQSDREAESVEFDRCLFRGGTLAGSRLSRVRFAHCVVETADWSNVDGADGRLDRFAAAGSRMTGLSWAGGVVRDAVFEDSRLDLSNWRYTRFDTVRFIRCDLRRADFTSADLRGAAFVDCDLGGAQFSGASMEGASLRGCDLRGIGGVASLRGAKVHRDDLAALAEVLATAVGIAFEG
ncbi:hypothetical protein Val02_60720 [Virgisporangium aliadipatigenens]|uniref:Pentapeptide repeat-containing protein n=1 Tax=Virgisporangium aliadipatigenens TaxID=741659 RepID=A0A8J3YPU1_9ACTN|nr:pentapeptide repeat-containing protein [Virgisporangium aliadipatigenens]GIJ49186.1 hypothetical protein Val02_60720 [Virgisporangium aliadipatigenens]